MVAIGLNGAVFEYGPVQAYGICLFGVVAGFRWAVGAVEEKNWLRSGAAGLCAGVAAASSLLFGGRCSGVIDLDDVLQSRRQPVEEVRGVRRGAAGSLRAGVLAVCPRARQTWFNLFRYHVFFRKLYWPDTTRHDLEILTRGSTMARLCCSACWRWAASLYIVRQSGWAHPMQGGVLPVRVAGGGAIRRSGPRASYVRALFSADGAVSGGTGGGRIVRSLASVRSGRPAVAGCGGNGAFRAWDWPKGYTSGARWTTGAPTSGSRPK